MYSAVGTALFGVRNLNKDNPGDTVRKYCAGELQLINAAKAGVVSVAKYNNAIGKSALSAVNVFQEAAKQNKVVNGALKAVNWGCNNINPILCASGGVKVLLSDDKLSAGITEVAALSTMFAGENVVKGSYDKIINSKQVQNGLKSASKNKFLKPAIEFLGKQKWGGKIGAVMKGVTLVGASIGSYAVGHSLGKDLAKATNAKLGRDVKLEKEVIEAEKSKDKELIA